ncbi:MAG: GGDEF domain-containing protein [Acidimicrobiales bacterium]
MPEDEARLVIESVLEELRGGHPENLDRAGRAWGRAHRSVSEMVGRLSSFREALAASGVDDPLKMHRALDRVTAAATEEVLHRLEHASRTDALTGVGNRRAFDETLSAAISAASRQGHEVTVVAVDLDGLKRINDTEGHAAGDAALLSLVRAFYAALRDEDTVFRVGGDEFVILLPFTSVGAAEVLMERIAGSGSPAFTWGAAGYPGDGSDARHLVEAADADLYRRRESRRAERVASPRRVVVGTATVAGTAAARAGARWSQMSPAMRWAWIPAAAVLLVSLLATLLSTSPNGGIVAKGAPHGSHPVTSPGQGSTSTVPTSPNGSGRGGGLLGGSSGTNFLTVGLNPQGGGNPGGGVQPPGTTTTTAPQSPRQGGVLGLVENLLSPVPVVGGQNGLIAMVGQVLTGTPVGPVVTTAAHPAPAATGTGGLLAVVGLTR